MNSLYTCSYRCRDFAGNNLLPMILPASAFNSCMIKFSIPDFNETIIQNIISLFLSFSNNERRKVVFSTQSFIGQYCSKRGERVPLSLYISRTRRERTFVAVHSDRAEKTTIGVPHHRISRARATRKYVLALSRANVNNHLSITY